MLTLKEFRLKHQFQQDREQITEAHPEELPQMLILRRIAIRVLPDGKRIAEYHHDKSGFSVIYPMLFSKGDKK